MLSNKLLEQRRGTLLTPLADGLFLDYHWKPEWIAESAARLHENIDDAAMAVADDDEAADSSRVRDVLVGVDVWGRGTFGGGGWSCRAALDAIRQSQTRGPSVALFGPAWTYEHEAGGDFSLWMQLEPRLWTGDGDMASGEIGAPTVVNANGDKGAAGADGACQGWSIKEAGGQGWSVASDDAWPGSSAPVSCFVTSHAWCRKSQVVSLPPGGQASSLTVAEWYRGTGPDFGDVYYLRAALLDVAGAAIAVRDTGEVVASAAWKRAALTFDAVPQEAVAVVIEHGGKDAEHWAGHFGTRMRGAEIRFRASSKRADADSVGCGIPCRHPDHPRAGTVSRAEAAAAPSGSAAACLMADCRINDQIRSAHFAADHGVRSALSSWSLRTCFNTGIGAATYKAGLLADDRPWTHMAATTLLPSFRGHLATEGLEHCVGAVPAAWWLPSEVAPEAAGMSARHSEDPAEGVSDTAHESFGVARNPPATFALDVSYHGAYDGGSSVLLSGQTPIEAGSGTGFAVLRLFATDVRIASSATTHCSSAREAGTNAGPGPAAVNDDKPGAGTRVRQNLRGGAPAAHQPAAFACRLIYRMEADACDVGVARVWPAPELLLATGAVVLPAAVSTTGAPVVDVHGNARPAASDCWHTVDWFFHVRGASGTEDEHAASAAGPRSHLLCDDVVRELRIAVCASRGVRASNAGAPASAAPAPTSAPRDGCHGSECLRVACSLGAVELSVQRANDE